MKYKVPFVNFPKQYQKIKPEIDKAIESCLEKGAFILQKEVEEFEENLAKFVGTRYAVGVNCGTDALFFSLLAAGIGKGDEVITVSETYVATISKIIHTGATPILVDVREDFLMDMDEVEKAITPQTKAILPVHMAGSICDMERLMALAKKHNLIVIEDACQALGAKAKQNGKMAGSFGLTGCFSFYPAKILGAYGDGGAVVTDDEKIANEIRYIRDGGRKSKLQIVKHGYNSLLDNVQAAVLNVKIKYLPGWIERRREIAKMYNEGLKNIPGLKLPKSQTYQDYILRAPKRDKLAKFLEEKRVEVLVRETIPNHLQKGLGLDHFKLPNTERFAREKIRLPVIPELTNEQVKYVIACIKEFYQS
jgi:dTDP-4-amino-4,6-dideoxygalactose transaminase